MAVLRRPTRTGSVLGVERAVDQQLEEGVVLGQRAGGDIRLVHRVAYAVVLGDPGHAGDRELVVDLLGSCGVERVPAVTAQVVHLRCLVADEHVETTDGKRRADGVQSRRAVAAQRGEVTESGPVLVEEVVTGRGELRSATLELLPTHTIGHGAQSSTTVAVARSRQL